MSDPTNAPHAHDHDESELIDAHDHDHPHGDAHAHPHGDHAHAHPHDAHAHAHGDHDHAHGGGLWGMLGELFHTHSHSGQRADRALESSARGICRRTGATPTATGAPRISPGSSSCW